MKKAKFKIENLTKSDDFLSAEIWLEKFQTNVELSVLAASIADLSKNQIKAIKNFETWDGAIYAKMEAYLFDYYQDTLHVTGADEPVISKQEDIWQYIYPATWIIPEDISTQDTNNNYYIYSEFGCDWEAEHGLTITVKNGTEIIYVGPFDDGSYLNDGKDADGIPMYGNYAIKADKDLKTTLEKKFKNEKITAQKKIAGNKEELLELAGAHCWNNLDEIKQSEYCFCTQCFARYAPEKIVKWLDDVHACCPIPDCGMAGVVLGSSCGLNIDDFKFDGLDDDGPEKSGDV